MTPPSSYVSLLLVDNPMTGVGFEMSIDLANEIRGKVCYGLWEGDLLPKKESKEGIVCFLIWMLLPLEGDSRKEARTEREAVRPQDTLSH